MKRISIQGEIYDAVPTGLFGDWIADGLFTPANAFTAALREAEENGEDVEVWINSPGGSVDAANEMLAAFQSFKGYKCVTVGGLAASAAAYFALDCGARVECHENTRFMFHAPVVLRGYPSGSGSMRDEAEALDKIAEPVKARLVALGVDAGRVDEGFQDDRALWLSADEALKYGIVQKIVKGAAPIPAPPDEGRISGVAARLPRLAAMLRMGLTRNNSKTTAAMNDEDENKTAGQTADENTPAPDPAKDEEAAAAPASASPAPEGASAALPDAAATLADSLAKAEALAAATLKRAEIAEKALAAAEATIAKYEEASKAAAARADELAAALETEKANHAALVGKALAPSPDPITPQNISARLKGLSPDQACAALLEAYGRK